MKSFQALFLITTVIASAAAANEPVASPAAANVERELAEYEKRHLQEQGTPATSPPQPTIPRPTGSYSYSYGGKSGKGGKSGSKGGKSGSSKGGKGGYSYGYGSGKGGKSGSKGGKGSKGGYSYGYGSSKGSKRS